MAQKISATIELADNISAQLQKLSNIVGSTAAEFSELAVQASKALDPSRTQELTKTTQQLTGQVDKLESETRSAGSEAEKGTQSFSGFKSAATDVDSLAKELENVSSATQRVTGQMGTLDNKTMSAVSSVEKESRSFDDLRRSAEKAIQKVGQVGNERLTGLIQSTGKAETKVDSLTTSVGKTKAEIESISMDGISGQLESLNDAINISNFINIAEAVGQVVDKFKDLAGAAVEASESVTDTVNTFKIGLGATEEETDKLMGVARDVFQNGYGESLQDVADKTVYLKQVMGDLVDDSELGSLLPQFITLNDAGLDFNETIRSTRNILSTFDGESVTHVLDVLAEANARGLNMSDELSDNLAEYAGRWGDAGVSLEKYMSLYEAGIKSGAYNADKVGDFLNEFMTSLSDGRFEESFENFSENTKNMFNGFKEGKASADEVLEAVLQDFQSMGSAYDQAALSSTLWSSLGEDNALSMITAMAGVENSYSDVAGASQKMAADNSNNVTTLKNLWTSFKDQALAPVGNALAGIGVSIVNIGESFASTIGGLLSGTITFPDLTQQGLDAINQFVNGFMSGLPQMATQGWEVITNFITGLEQRIPELILGAVDMITSLAQGIGDNLPTILEKAGETLAAFAQGLRQNLPTIIGAGIEMIGNLITGLFQRLPDIISAGASLFTGLLTGIVNMIPSIVQAGVDIVAGLLSGLWSNLPTLLSTGLDIISSLITGILQGVPTLIFEGFQLVVKFAASVVEAIPQLVATAQQMAGDFLAGLVQGLTDSFSTVSQWFQDNFGWLINWVKDLFGVHSPSTVFMEIGGFLVEGFLQGLSNAWTAVTQWFEDAWNGLKDTVSNLWNNLFGGGEEEQPVQIDYSSTIADTRAQLEQLRNEVQSAYSEMAGYVSTQFQAAAQSAIDAFSTMTGSVISQVGGLNSALSGAFAGAATQVANLGIAFSGLPGQVSAVLTQIGALSVALSQASVQAVGLGSSFTGIPERIAAIFVQAGLLSTAFRAASTEIANFIAAFEGVTQINVQIVQLTQSLIALESVFSGYGAAIMDELAEGIEQESNQVKNALDALINILNQNMLALISSFYRYGVNLMDQLSNGIKAQSSLVTGAISSLLNAITQNILSTISAFQGYGKTMMNELANGIRSETAQVVDATNELVTKLKDTFTKGLGIHSPSTVMAYYAKMAGAGWIQGLSDSDMVSFTSGIIEEMKESFKNGQFDAAELVGYLDEDTLKVINYLNEKGDDTTSSSNQSGGQITYPLIGTTGTQTSWFGYRPPEDTGGIGTTNHGGVDLAAPTGTPIAAALAGTVTTAGMSDGYGNLVVIDHGNGVETYYGHMSAIGTSVGATVSQGQNIGAVGSTGNSTGPHLHFEVRQNGEKVDPQPYLEGAGLTAAGSTLVSAIQAAYNKAHGIATVTMSGNTGTWQGDASAEAIAPFIVQALQITGQDPSLLEGLMYAAKSESGYDPNAINLWDSNAAAGTPSKGLFQTIDSTFNAYKIPGYDDIWNPLHNAIAAIRYMIDRYGSVANVVNPRLGGWYGYATGTESAVPGYHWVGEKGPELIRFRGGEQVLTNSESTRLSQLFTNVNSNQAGSFESSDVLNNNFQNFNTAGSSYISAHSYTESDNETSENLNSLYSVIEKVMNISNLYEGTSNYTRGIIDTAGRPGHVQVGNYRESTGENTSHPALPPINMTVNSTINNSEEFRANQQEVERAMTKALRQALSNSAQGTYWH